MKTVSILGCGALGRELAQHLEQTLAGRYRLLGVLARHAAPAETLAHACGCRAYRTMDELLADRPDYVAELAGAEAVRAYGEKILRAGVNLIVASAGALADDAFCARLARAAEEGGSIVHVTSGAIGGFDLLRTLTLMGGASVTVENEKAPESLNGAPFLAGRTLPENAPKQVFAGSAREAIAGFPRNVNVAVAAALASCGVEQTEVRIDSVPGLTENRHRVRIDNGRARAELLIASQPDPANPKSSTMTAWSVLALLDSLASPIRFF